PVEPFLETVSQKLVHQVSEFDPNLAPYANYALNGMGKRLRPALVALSAGALGPVNDDHVTVAVIIEMVHLATLVHDDVMDEAQIRRNRPTLAANWGNETAVLFGDCLFAQALKLAASFPTPEICRAVAAATNTVCAGEILQTRGRGDFRFSRADYFKVIRMKTAELFALSCDLAACLSDSTTAQRRALKEFGMNFGTAYQIYDDCLDLFGSEASAGKSLGTDLAKGKLTLPMLVLWERASATERARLEKLIQHPHNGEFTEISSLLAAHDTLAESQETFREYLDLAQQSVRELPESTGRVGLLGLVEYLSRQTEALSVGL
ncbi:MAG TPA: polyprenyl synthetase family protein, partial [Verrucomicrobiae bacterium]|nr:polyprenyl synthetase family protein [Verrucomicrobiae bacterium]